MAKDYQYKESFDSGLLPVSDLHKIHYKQCGKKDGKPVVFLHGGPGGQTTVANAAFFDPDIYRVVLFDQRGSGQSLPTGEIKENTSQHLVEDIETLRKHLGIEKWHMVFGGSWGSTLALLYSQSHPDKVGSLVLRGVFTVRKHELDYANTPNTGPAMLFPEEFNAWLNFLSPEDREKPMEGYHRLAMSDDPAIWRPAVRAWNTWESSISKVQVTPEDFKQLDDERWSLCHARMETHYFLNGAFVEEGHLLKEENINKIRHIPCSIVQGRFDVVCPPQTAWELHQKLPDSKLYIIPAAGHSAKEPGTYSKLIEICDEYGQKTW